MRAWTTSVDEPFRGDEQFWRSVAASMDALAALVVAVVVFALVGGLSVVFFVAPVLLLVVAGVHGRASSAVTRPSYATRDEWRDAERRAVASAMRGALTRRRFRRSVSAS